MDAHIEEVITGHLIINQVRLKAATKEYSESAYTGLQKEDQILYF